MRMLASTFVALLIVAVGLGPSPGTAQAQTTVTVDPAKINLGFMNVSNLPPPDGDGAFQFSSVWDFVALTASYSGDELTLGPAPIAESSEFWYIGEGGPGAQGNKIMEANGYAEETGTLAGQTVTFNGVVLSNSLTSAHSVVAFIRDFAPDFSSFLESTVTLTEPGMFSVTLTTIDDAARHVQYGFQMVGVNVWPTDVDQFGSLTVGPEQPSPVESKSWGSIKSLFQ